MAVLDINMPQLTGLQVLGAIEREELATRVILLSGSATNEQIATADWE
jgi:YesN/AraC family two-component response regulator